MDYYTALVMLIKAFAMLSALLLLGTFLRAKVPVFQSLYLPASVIGGFIGLLLGPNCIDILPFSEDFMAIVGSAPSVLIAPVFAAIPMCASIGKGDKNAFKKSSDIAIITYVLGAFFLFQCLIGIIGVMISRLIGGNTYDAMGLEVAFGFNGGHGMAASLGSALKDFGNPAWQAAQDVVMTTSTVGLIGGILIGIVVINIGIKKGWTTQITSVAKTSRELRTGLYTKDAELPELCKQTSIPNSIETLSLHLALILVATGIGYWLESKLSTIDNIIFQSMAGWFYAMLVMLVLWQLIKLFKCDHHFNEEAKNKLVGIFTDYIVVAAITAINVTVLTEYWVTIVVMCVLGLVVTPLCIMLISKKFLHKNWFEKSLGMLGANTGVFVTGILLIKMADPELKTDALNDYSIGATICNLFAMPLISLEMGIMASGGELSALGFAAAISAGFLILAVITHKASSKASEKLN